MVSLLAVGCFNDEPALMSVDDPAQTSVIKSLGGPGARPLGKIDLVSRDIAGPELAISPFVGATGQVSLSADAVGTNGPVGIVQVETPGPMPATVRGAYFMAASTGFTMAQIAAGDIMIDGMGVTFDVEIPNAIESYNYWADVTAMVEGKINAAAPGTRVDFEITEMNTDWVDGEILVVIFDDPNVTTDNSIFLLFGAQDIAGDTFDLVLADPIDLADPELVVDMSLGISFGFQEPTTTDQFSLVDVNGNRLTSSAGGQDDGEGNNGALITVGGLDDTNVNPPPMAPPADFNDPDDELYNLIPYVNDGDTEISVFTENPSTDDNILFAGFFLTVEAALLEIPMDIKPTSCPNPFNYKIFEEEPNNSKSMRGGVLPVALLGTETFDVSQIDPASLMLEGVAPVRFNYEDVTTPYDGDDCGCTTEGPDGFTDLTLKFRSSDIAAAMGMVYAGDVVELSLTGTLLDGTPFIAKDCVRILGKMEITR
jgi:hypothetical protein